MTFNKLKTLLIKLLDLYKYHRSYSQDGEDMVLRSFFEETFKSKHLGYYVDVGAHHPVRFSNTFYFYRKGWSGINIDATPGSMRLFKFLRKRDINLEIGIGPKSGELIFYCFNEPALNTFSKDIALERSINGKYFIKDEIVVPILPLSDVLKQHLPTDQRIDFMSIDVEGMDEVVLSSNDWIKFRPSYILAEDANFDFDLERTSSGGVLQLLYAQNYRLIAKTKRTLIFKDEHSTFRPIKS